METKSKSQPKSEFVNILILLGFGLGFAAYLLMKFLSSPIEQSPQVQLQTSIEKPAILQMQEADKAQETHEQVAMQEITLPAPPPPKSAPQKATPVEAPAESAPVKEIKAADKNVSKIKPIEIKPIAKANPTPKPVLQPLTEAKAEVKVKVKEIAVLKPSPNPAPKKHDVKPLEAKIIEPKAIAPKAIAPKAIAPKATAPKATAPKAIAVIEKPAPTPTPVKQFEPRETLPSLDELAESDEQIPEVINNSEAADSNDEPSEQYPEQANVQANEQPNEQVIEQVATKAPEALAQKGRPLLRIMEFGKGPIIDIAWPDQDEAMQSLYQELTRCYGMKSLLMGQDGRLYQDAMEFKPNMDLYSGFLRQASGNLPYAESRQMANNRNLGNFTMVRIFPRRLDALFLGGLSNLIGDDFMKATITGSYFLDRNQQLKITNLIVNGLPINQDINLSFARQCQVAMGQSLVKKGII